MLIEVIATSLSEVRAAAAGGADRIELVSGLIEGGLTPSLALVRQAAEASPIPVHVMVRPHSRSFVYDKDDVAVILEDVALIREAGAAGIAFGALTPDGTIDAELLKAVLERSGELAVTFHRAFDELDPARREEALRQLANYPRVTRVLTSGGREPAPQAMPQIAALVRATAELPIRILAGHGLTLDNAKRFVRETGARELHFGSAVRFGGSPMGAVDPARVARLKEALGGT